MTWGGVLLAVVVAFVTSVVAAVRGGRELNRRAPEELDAERAGR